MFSQKMCYHTSDAEAGKILNDFLPDRIFDAHAHLLDTALLPGLSARFPHLVCDWDKYQEEMRPLLGNPRQLRINAIVYPDKTMADPKSGTLEASDAFCWNSWKSTRKT